MTGSNVPYIHGFVSAKGATFLSEEGEIDFIVSSALTSDPYIDETILEHQVRVETSVEIIAKKVWHRGPDFKARDIFDFSLVIEKEPQALSKLDKIFTSRKDVIQIKHSDKQLREDFLALDTLEYTPTFDQCISAVRRFLDQFPVEISN